MEMDRAREKCYQVNMVEPDDIYRRMALGETFVVNLVTDWCPDCTERQKPHMAGFVEKMTPHKVDVLQVTVQLQKGCFISAEHEKLTTQFGGPGYPRTVFIKQGKSVDQNNVEVITKEGLSVLAEKFLALLA